MNASLFYMKSRFRPLTFPFSPNFSVEKGICVRRPLKLTKNFQSSNLILCDSAPVCSRYVEEKNNGC